MSKEHFMNEDTTFIVEGLDDGGALYTWHLDEELYERVARVLIALGYLKPDHASGDVGHAMIKFILSEEGQRFYDEYVPKKQ